MALIKKQIFRPSKDENLQQFLAKKEEPIPFKHELAGAKGANAEMRWGQPSSKDKAKTRARAEGKIIGVPEKEGDTPKQRHDKDPFNYKPERADRKFPRSEQPESWTLSPDLRTTPKPAQSRAAKKVKSEPKSPWDDESDAVTQKAFEVDPEGGTRRVPSADDKKKADSARRDRLLEHGWKYVKDHEDQGSDNSNSADDRINKARRIEARPKSTFSRPISEEEYEQDEESQSFKNWQAKNAEREQSPVKKAVQDAWMEKGRYWERSTGDPFPPDTPSTAASSRYPASETPSSKRMDEALSGKKDRTSPETKTGEPTRTPGKGQTAKFREGKWESKMQKAVWDAWMEKQEKSVSMVDKLTGKKRGRRFNYGNKRWNQPTLADRVERTGRAIPRGTGKAIGAVAEKVKNVGREVGIGIKEKRGDYIDKKGVSRPPVSMSESTRKQRQAQSDTAYGGQSFEQHIKAQTEKQNQTPKKATEAAGLEYAAKSMGGEFIDMNYIQKGVWEAWLEKDHEASTGDAEKVIKDTKAQLNRDRIARDQRSNPPARREKRCWFNTGV